ncbi:MAG: flavocytochrome c [Bacteroidaceae bacterium]|nr:flavocytochrome c [Bacteroidaceae bacterium]
MTTFSKFQRSTKQIISFCARSFSALTVLFVLSSIMAMSSCSDDDTPTETADLVLNDGEWTGTGEGRSGSIIVKVLVRNHQVEQVTMVSQSESVFAQDAINSLVEKALGRRDLMSVEVDGISGATLTSTGVIDAINTALQAAMGRTADADKNYTDGTCDIVVVGAGGAGLSAAVAAAETDSVLKIVVLEKQGILGGNTNYSTGGINAAETAIQQELGIEDSKQLFYDDTMRGGKYENIPSLVRNLVNNASATISWLTGLGADLTDVGLMGGSSVRRTHRPKGGSAIGPHLMKILKAACQKENIELRTSNRVTGLLSAADGSVTGVRVQNADGSSYKLAAQAVVIATGGFGANIPMVAQLQPSLSGFATLNHPGATGDAFAWVTNIGGATVQMANIQIHPTAEANSHILITEAVRGNGAILVNNKGQRFCNEMDTRDVVSAAILAQTQGEALLVFDQKVRKSLASIETYTSQHLLSEGNTIAALAAAVSVPDETLSQTISRYNIQQKAGRDDDFGRSATAMPVSLDTPPFYAVRVTPAIHHTMGGLSVNTQTQVLRADGTPIVGLYAAGEVTGGLHGANRLGGNGVADIVVNGRLAGLAAAALATGAMAAKAAV